MRKAQISIKMELVGDQAANGHIEEIRVYADANSIFEAICSGFYELLGALQKQGHDLPSFGRREHSTHLREPREVK